MLTETKKNTWLDRPILAAIPGFTVEILLVTIILLLAVVSRFYDVGARVMSHDEVNHVVPSYNYSEGQIYRYDPVTHGPLQFHMMAFSYFLLGSSDMASRLPAVLLSIASIAIVLFAYRRYLGRAGAIVAGVLFLISPFMLFYGRYARNEAYIIVWTVMLIYAVLRYLETGQKRYLYLFTLATALQFIDKATSYIFAAEMLLFLTLFFIQRIGRRKWAVPVNLGYFIGLFLAAILFAGAGMGLSLVNKPVSTPAVPLAPNASPGPALPVSSLSAVAQIGIPIALGLSVLCTVAAIYFLIKGLGWKAMRDERSFDLLILQVTIVLPMLGALPIKLAALTHLIIHPQAFYGPSCLSSLWV
jgi:4-amino-4-deoxy-L-arabinose transferase-like glycosyltransferase